MNLDLLGAIMAGIAGLALGIRQIMLSPRNETYPVAPVVVRWAMFVLAGIMLVTSQQFFLHAAQPGLYAGEATILVLAMLGCLSAYHMIMVLNVAAQRYRPEVWRRLHRAADTVARSCPEMTNRPKALQALLHK